MDPKTSNAARNPLGTGDPIKAILFQLYFYVLGSMTVVFYFVDVGLMLTYFGEVIGISIDVI